MAEKLYHRITEYSATEWCLNCQERKAICPECGGWLCVFCEDACPFCSIPLF